MYWWRLYGNLASIFIMLGFAIASFNYEMYYTEVRNYRLESLDTTHNILQIVMAMLSVVASKLSVYLQYYSLTWDISLDRDGKSFLSSQSMKKVNTKIQFTKTRKGRRNHTYLTSSSFWFSPFLSLTFTSQFMQSKMSSTMKLSFCLVTFSML